MTTHKEALLLINNIASGSTTVNSLQHIATISQAALAQPEQEPTRSQKMRDAGIQRRPKGWDKESDEPKQPFGWLYSLIVEGQVVNEKFTHVNWDTKYEPFGRHGVDHGGKVTKTALYTTPPQPKEPEHDWKAEYIKQVELHNQTLDELRNALAQPEQVCGFDVVLDESMPTNTFKLAQPEQEPVAWAESDKQGDIVWGENCFSDDPEWLDNPMPLYTTPPQRKPLTDEQRKNMGDKYGGKLHRPDSAAYWYFKGIDDTEAAHGIKE